MALSLTDAQWKELGDKLFLCRSLAFTKLSVPQTTTGVTSLSPFLDPLTTDARFKDVGIGVVLFANNLQSERIWLHNGDVPWRAGSTNKIAILLAAVQLREDVRVLQDFVKTAADMDALFASPRLWKMSPIPKTNDIADPAVAPRISTIFDLTKTPADFVGPSADSPDAAGITNRVVVTDPTKQHLAWWMATDYDFTERLWPCGARSDNVAASSLISEIGIDYLKAVQRAYGLFDPPNGLKMLLCGPFTSSVDTSVAVSNFATTKFRDLHWSSIEYQHVTDAQKTGAGFTDQRSYQATSAASLAAYMKALIRLDLTSFGHGFALGAQGCTTIQANLSRSSSFDTFSHIAEGIAKVAIVTKSRSKIGLLDVGDNEPGPLNCEFCYVETQEKADATKVLKYGVVVTGLKTVGAEDAVDITRDLGQAIHQALPK